MSYADSLFSGTGASSESRVSELGVNSTKELLERLDMVEANVPRMLDYLARALGTLTPKPAGTKDDLWQANLAGYSKYYYALLDQIQTDLRYVVRQIRLEQRSPLALRPPPSAPSIPLPVAFAPLSPVPLTGPGGEPLSASTLASFPSVDGDERPSDGRALGLYAKRLEVKVLQDLAKALRDVGVEGPRAEAEAVMKGKADSGRSRTDLAETNGKDVDMDN